jgi:hypothetical protein
MNSRRLAIRLVFACLLVAATLACLEIGARIFLAIQGREQHDKALARLESFAADQAKLRSSVPIFSLNVFWGYGHTQGYSSQDYFNSLNAPYDYPLSKEEFAQRVAGLPANNWGFQADRDYPVAERDAYVVGIFGGSVANFFYATMRHDLERGLSRIVGRRVVVLNFALGAAKQPQQLQILTFFGAVGQRLDLVLNIDGLNEVTVPPRNAQSDVAVPLPLYGVLGLVLWPRRFAGSISDYFAEAERTAATAAFLQASVRWNARVLHARAVEVVAVAVFSTAERRLADKLAATVAGNRSQSESELTHLPGYSRLFGTDDPVEQGILVWMNATRTMANVARGMGAEYVEFLQPSQYVTRKNFGDEERAIAFDQFNEELARGYPRLLQRVEDIQREGVKVYPLTGIFDDTREPVFVDGCCHFNMLGNRLMAEAILARLRAELPAAAKSQPKPPSN